MKEPKVRMWIDARNEKFSKGDTKSKRYKIKNIKKDEVKQKLYEAVGTLVKEIRLISEKEEKVEILYNENLINLTFIDYRLRLRGLEFSREENKHG